MALPTTVIFIFFNKVKMIEIWRTKDGETIPIKDMDTSHIKNAINFMRKKCFESLILKVDEVADEYDKFIVELATQHIPNTNIADKHKRMYNITYLENTTERIESLKAELKKRVSYEIERLNKENQEGE